MSSTEAAAPLEPLSQADIALVRRATTRSNRVLLALGALALAIVVATAMDGSRAHGSDLLFMLVPGVPVVGYFVWRSRAERRWADALVPGTPTVLVRGTFKRGGNTRPRIGAVFVDFACDLPPDGAACEARCIPIPADRGVMLVIELLGDRPAKRSEATDR